MEKDIPQIHSLFHESLSARDELPLCELLAREGPEEPQTTKAVTIDASCMSELDGKFLLLVTPQTLSAR